MKICPVCQATAFDDAETCFGCMHQFGDEPPALSAAICSPDVPPEFHIRFTPTREQSGALTWKCVVEV